MEKNEWDSLAVGDVIEVIGGIASGTQIKLTRVYTTCTSIETKFNGIVTKCMCKDYPEGYIWNGTDMSSYKKISGGESMTFWEDLMKSKISSQEEIRKMEKDSKELESKTQQALKDYAERIKAQQQKIIELDALIEQALKFEKKA